MINELKYRAWDKLTKKICEVEVIDFSNKTLLLIHLEDSAKTKYNASFEEAELMQYLGVNDKKGREICEGDIVKWTYPNIDDDYYKDKAKFGSIFGVVYWIGNNCSFSIKQISRDTFNYNKNELFKYEDLMFYDYDGAEFQWNDLEVVGNIYENKEFYDSELEKYKLESIGE